LQEQGLGVRQRFGSGGDKLVRGRLRPDAGHAFPLLPDEIAWLTMAWLTALAST
jgi:hypothetical protein